LAKRACVVFDSSAASELRNLRRAIDRRCREHGWDQPVWVQTVGHDAGRSRPQQTAARADLVVACGDDETVMAVASGRAGASAPIAVVPTGTANLLARSVGVPQEAEDAIDVAFTGRQRRLDLGRMGDRTFAVMTGVSLDSPSSDALTSPGPRCGWLVYLMAGLPQLLDRPMVLRVSLDGRPVAPEAAWPALSGLGGALRADAKLLPDNEALDGRQGTVLVAARSASGWRRTAARGVLDLRTQDVRQLDPRLASVLWSKSSNVNTASVAVKVPH